MRRRICENPTRQACMAHSSFNHPSARASSLAVSLSLSTFAVLRLRPWPALPPEQLSPLIWKLVSYGLSLPAGQKDRQQVCSPQRLALPPEHKVVPCRERALISSC